MVRRRTCAGVAASFAGVVLALFVREPASSDGYLLTNGGFESGASGWSPAVGATLVVDGSLPPADGSNAAHLTSTGTGTMSLASKYWESPEATAGMSYTLTARLRDSDPATAVVTARLDLLSASEQVVASVSGTLGTGDGDAYGTVTAGPAVAPASAKYLRVTFTAQASGAGARLSVDSVGIAVTAPATPIPTPEPPAPSSSEAPDAPAPVSTPAPTPRATATPRAPATPSATPSPSPTPAVVSLPGASLRNIDFEQGVAGWSVTRGRMTVAPSVAGPGVSLILTAVDDSTAWVQQTVAVEPGGWFTASALLAPLEGVEAAWLRIAWYASVDGSGTALSTTDSPAVASAVQAAMVRAGTYEVVSTGPVQAPALAHSARVRILLRPAGGRGGSVVIDDVAFEPADPSEGAPRTSAPPPAPPAAAAAAATAAPPGPARPAPTPPPTAVSAPDVGTDSVAVAAGQRGLRITEIMSNPAEPGADTSFEWIEVTNTGQSPTALSGVTARDRQVGSVLPPVTLGPGDVLVIAAPNARLPEGLRVARLARAIGNGLGNAGDRVALVGADGVEIDGFEYGEGADGPALPAPGPGQSLERFFSATGVLLDARLTDTPTPGIAGRAPAPARGPATVAAAPVSGVDTGSAGPAWAILGSLAGGLLLGAGVARTAAAARGRGREA